MTLRSGSRGAYPDSLGEAIEAAFAGELFAQRQALLPAEGAEDRRLLFSAIGQGVLQYLARAPHNDFSVRVSGSILGRHDVDVFVASLRWSGSSAGGTVTGSGFAPGPITLQPLRQGSGPITTQVGNDGTFSRSLGPLPTGTVIDARDGQGNAAQAVVR